MVGYPLGNIVQLLILSGQRKSEIGGLQRAWIGTDRIALPATATKNRREHAFPTGKLAVSVLGDLPGKSAAVFVSPRSDGEAPLPYIYLGREVRTRWGTLDDIALEAECRKVMGRLNPNFRRFKDPVKSLSGGQRQSVAIARAIHFNARILIMDVPTAALGPQETAQLVELWSDLGDAAD
jgi:hypothetical protein